MKYKTQRKKMKSEKQTNSWTESLSRTTRQQMMDHIVKSPYGKEKKNYTSPKDRGYLTGRNKCQVLSKSGLTLWVNLITMNLFKII